MGVLILYKVYEHVHSLCIYIAIEWKSGELASGGGCVDEAVLVKFSLVCTFSCSRHVLARNCRTMDGLLQTPALSNTD